LEEFASGSPKAEKKKKKEKTLDDYSDDLISPRRASKVAEDESEEFTSAELTVETKDKKKKGKKKDKDYNHGMMLSDLLAPPPTKVFHTDYW
jgi:hypothetical protein